VGGRRADSVSEVSRLPKTALIALLGISLFTTGALPAVAADDVTVEGGGWGHAIGMPQFGAKALAEDGESAEEILQYFYTGARFGEVGDEFTSHAEPLHIGIAQHQTSMTFVPVNGNLKVCLSGVCHTALPGESWAIKSVELEECRLFKNGAPVDAPGACSGEITWTNKPATRVSFPGLSRVYARGRVIFKPAGTNKFHAVVSVPLEAYLLGLGEVPNTWPMEALEAQVIAARSYALYKAWIYRFAVNSSCGCHLYASTVDQAYRGWYTSSAGDMTEGGPNGSRWVAAVDGTEGRAMWHSHHGSSRTLEAYYSSSTGGATENNEDVWGGNAYPYLRSKPDPGPTSWTNTVTKQQFASALGWDAVTGAVVAKRFVSGSPSEIIVTGRDGGAAVSATFTGGQLRSLLGLRSHHIKSFKGFLPAKFSILLPGDFDGDGKDEVAAFSGDDGTWWVFQHESGTLVGYEWADFSTASGWIGQMVGDFDGDGRDDIAQFHPSNGTWWVSRSTGSKFSTVMWADFSTASGWVARNVGDYDGDGRDDIAQFHPSNGTWWVSRSNGSRFSTGLWADFSTASGWVAQQVGDFDADGKDDIANFHPSNGTWWVSRSNGSRFSTGLWADFSTPKGWGPQLVGDFNGDGRDDIANFHSSNGTWWVSRSNGSRFSTGLWADYTTASGWAPQLVGDFNGDGTDDIANFYPGNGRWWVSRSVGSSFSTYFHGAVSPTSGWSGQLAADVDGDGADELVGWRQSTQVWSIK